MIKRFIYSVLLLLSVLTVRAQIIYECDFEDADERAQWVLNECANPTKYASLTNYWNIGKPGHFAPTGENGLFIGTSEGATEAKYSAATTIENVAYRHLPHLEPGAYTLTFNWLANCKSGQEGLYACLVPSAINTYSAGTALTMSWFKQCVIPVSVDTVLHGTSTWDVATVHFAVPPTSDGDYKLVFVFFAVKGAANKPAPCVDNISLFVAGQCNAPFDVSHTIENADVNLQWKGTADKYDIRTYSYETGEWQEMSVPASAGNHQLVSNVQEGIGVFFLRSRCGDKYSEWVKYEKFIFHKGVRCIDYMDLNSKTCAYGSFASPGATKGVVDFGYADKYSRHTLHYVKGEIDPRTMEGYMGLQTKPDDALASVRLGNWNIGSEAEQMTYTYKVADDGNAILKLRYAVVMEDPAHDASAQPKFTLSILHNNRKLDGGCGEANFVSGGGLRPEDGWHISGGASTPVYWKDWTTVSVNLRDYIGETITVKLTTYDCSQSGHYGYAYFVLECEGGEMSDLNCGEDNPTTQFNAPDGFDYRWYRTDDPDKTLSNKQTYTIEPLDTNKYEVDVISKTNGQCYYTLRACGMPRIPTPRVTYDVYSTACSNRATFYNTSCVYVQNMITGLIGPSDENVTSLIWDFGDGVVEDNLSGVVQHEFPTNGGQYTVRVTAGISHNACQVTKEIVLNFPDISNDTTEILVEACRKNYPYGYTFGGKTYFNDVDSLFTLTSVVTGCDSVVHLDLNWHEYGPFVVKDTVCEGYVYDFFGRKITEGGVYDTVVVSPCGCDSAVSLQLNVVPRLTVDYPSTVAVCADNRTMVLPYEVTKGTLNTIELRFSNAEGLGLDSVYRFNSGEEVIVVLPEPINPDLLSATLTFLTPSCPIPAQPLTVELRYPTSVFTQEEGLMALMNEPYSGYDFVEFQWYRDGQRIEGAVYSYLSATNDDLGHVYRVDVKQAGSSRFVSTCDLIYLGTTALPNLLKAEGPYRVYTPFGMFMKTADDWSQVQSLMKGMYIISDGTNAIKIIR
ncbi:MAG: PKD domain-containing protein [Paludibacteraceae bacterium]|nr:PKD domain-containing protein [Paludibacteraceae bacterium]